MRAKSFVLCGERVDWDERFKSWELRAFVWWEGRALWSTERRSQKGGGMLRGKEAAASCPFPPQVAGELAAHLQRRRPPLFGRGGGACADLQEWGGGRTWADGDPGSGDACGALGVADDYEEAG